LHDAISELKQKREWGMYIDQLMLRSLPVAELLYLAPSILSKRHDPKYNLPLQNCVAILATILILYCNIFWRIEHCNGDAVADWLLDRREVTANRRGFSLTC
jgi:hypothetical protein